MATESVATYSDPAIKALSSYDSSVFLGWLEAVGDIMLNKGEVAPEVSQELGGLVMALAMAARELQNREREELKGR